MGERLLTGILISILLFVLLDSCEYYPDKVYLRNADKNVQPPEVQIIEMNLEADTIFLYSNKNVHFRFVSSNQEIKTVRFTIDDVEKYLVSSNTGDFIIDYNSLFYGIHTLNLEVSTASGTNSIAEHLGLESFVFLKSWIINVIDYIGNTNNTITSQVRNGLLNLEWTRYRGSNFKEYLLCRPGDTAEVKLQSKYYIDSSYVGERASYVVKVRTDNGLILTWGEIIIPPDFPELFFSVSGENLYTVTWNKSTFYNAVDSFKLYLSNDFRATYSTIYSTINPEDTSFIISSTYFGDIISLKLKVIPRKSSNYRPSNYMFFETYMSDIRPGFTFSLVNGQIIQDISQVSKNEFVCIAGYGNLIRYNVLQKNVVEIYTYRGCEFYSLSTSPSGRYLTTYGKCSNDIILANSDNLNNNNVRNVKSLIGDYYLPYLPVSDIGNILVDGIRKGFFIYNHQKDSIIAYYHKDNITANGIAISLNSDYLILRDDSLRLVHFADSQFINIHSYSKDSPPGFFKFHGTEADRLVVWDGTQFTVKRCSDFSDIYGFMLSDRKILNVDYYNNRMLTWSDGHLFIRNLTDGILIKDIPVIIDPTSDGRACYIVNNAIVSITGVLYFIEE